MTLCYKGWMWLDYDDDYHYHDDNGLKATSVNVRLSSPVQDKTIVLSNSFAVNVKRIDFLDPIGSIQNEVDKLITQNINKIVVLGHGGYLLDQKIAKEVKGIDIVIGGHSHTFLYSGKSLCMFIFCRCLFVI